MPVLAILGAILVVLKVLGHIQLAWVWVLAPFWIGLAVFLVLILVGLVGILCSVDPRGRW